MNLVIRPCRSDEAEAMLEIVNAGAEAYRDVIPADRWHEPYMDAQELAREIEAGVRFSGCEIDEQLVAVMGIQSVRNVELIRHAYVHPSWQGRGIGTKLMDSLRETTTRNVLVGTWAAATWAIRFYERYGFTLTPEEAKTLLLQTYWTIPERQIETSVVLAWPALTLEAAKTLVSQA